MGRRNESRVNLLSVEDGYGRHAGQDEFAGSSKRPGLPVPPMWVIPAVLLVGAIAAALTVAGIAFSRLDNYQQLVNVDRICNRGDNSGTGLEDCPNVAGVPGFALLSAAASDPTAIFVNRISKGNGILVTETADSHIEVSALIESLSSSLIVGVSPSPTNAITLDLNLTNPNTTTSCDITCDANYFVRLTNGGTGYGLAMGTDHTFANDNTHTASAILSGWNNALIASGGSTIVGGRYNTISDTFCSFLGAGRNNTVRSPRSGIVIGEYNSLNSNQSFIGAGEYNVIDSIYEANAIIAGDTNVLYNCTRSITGAGYDNGMSETDDSGIISGRGNAINNSVTSIIGAGTDNYIVNGIASAVLVGNNNNVTDSSSAMIGSGLQNVIQNSTASSIVSGLTNKITYGNNVIIGAGMTNQITGSSGALVEHSAIVSCNTCFMTGKMQSSFIGAGNVNRMLINSGMTAAHMFIGAGASNVISLTAGPSRSVHRSFIVAGSSNSIVNSETGGVVAGNGNYIGNCRYAFIGAGSTNTLNTGSVALVNDNSAIVTGTSNVIFGRLNSCMIGTGTNNNITKGSNVFDMFTAFIGAGSSNHIESTESATANSIATFIGAGTGNNISDCSTSGIVAGMANKIERSTGSFIGTGDGNTITDANYVAILAGSGVSVNGQLNANTAITQHVNVRGSFETASITAITGDHSVVPGDYILLANGVAATISLGDSTTTPDGLQLVIRDIGDASAANVIVSCVTSGCTICPPGGACVVGGTDTINTQYATRHYVFQGPSERWVSV